MSGEGRWNTRGEFVPEFPTKHPVTGDECRCAPRPGVGFTVHQSPCRFTPAEPDAGEGAS